MAEELQPEQEVGNENLAEIEKELIRLNPKIFKGVKPQQKEQIIRSLVVTLHKTHIGPLPAPETLKEYSELIPNGADRIMKMAEAQQEHRMGMENKVIRGQMQQSNIGQFLAFFIGIAALSASTYCIVNGHEWSGSIIGIGGLTGLVTAFIRGKSNQDKDLEDKRPHQRK